MGGRRRMQPNQGNDIIEVSSVLERIGGDKDFLKELLDLYIEDFSEQYPRLEEALGQKDFTAILELGHCLKGSSANLSLNHLREHAYRVEKAGEAGNLEDAQTAAGLLWRILSDGPNRHGPGRCFRGRSLFIQSA